MDERFHVDVVAEPAPELLLRVVGLLTRHRVDVDRLHMRDAGGERRVEVVLRARPDRVELLSGHLRNLVHVRDVTTWTFRT